MRNKGFSIIEIVLVVVLVILLGFVGWRVWEAKKDKGNTNQNTQQNQANEQKSEELNPDGYLHIKELGVKIKLTEGIRDAVYYYEKLSDGTEVAILSSQSLLSKYASCAPTASTTPLGLITKSSTAMNSTNPEENRGGLILQGKGSYYYFSGPQGSCQSDSSDETQGKMVIEISQQMKTISFDEQ